MMCSLILCSTTSSTKSNVNTGPALDHYRMHVAGHLSVEYYRPVVENGCHMLAIKPQSFLIDRDDSLVQHPGLEKSSLTSKRSKACANCSIRSQSNFSMGQYIWTIHKDALPMSMLRMLSNTHTCFRSSIAWLLSSIATF